MPAGQGRGELDLPEGRGGGLQGPRPAHPALRRGRRGDGLRRGGAGGDRRQTRRDPVPRLPDLDRGGRVPGRRRHLRPECPDRRDGDRGARGLRRRVHRGHPAAEGGLPAREGERGDLERLLLLSRQQPRARGDARGLPLPRDQGRARHGHRQCRPARRLRGGPEGPPRAGRGRPAEPPAGRHRAAHRLRAHREGAGEGAGRRGRVAQAERSRSASRTRSCGASTSSSRPTRRRRG